MAISLIRAHNDPHLKAQDLSIPCAVRAPALTEEIRLWNSQRAWKFVDKNPL